MKLQRYDNRKFDRGSAVWIETLWGTVQGMFFSTWLPGSAWRVEILRIFGAKIGTGVNIKPHVRIKFPWRLSVGDYSWIGENAWIDNLDQVTIGSNVCISQGVYICTGSHDYKDETFRLVTKAVSIEDESWIAAFSKIAPGVTVRKRSVVAFGAVLTKDTRENSVYAGNPAEFIRSRE